MRASGSRLPPLLPPLLMMMLPTFAEALRTPTPAALGRRMALRQGAAAALAAAVVAPLSTTTILPPLPCIAADEKLAPQRGAEDAYKTQTFSSDVCTKRALNGACVETGKASAAPSAAPKLLQMQPEEQSDYVKSLIQKSADNKEANDRLVKEKTIKADEGATFGPFAKNAPIMRADGTFDVVPLGRYKKLDNKGKITKTKTGLDMYIPGFDPDAPEPVRQKFLGIF